MSLDWIPLALGVWVVVVAATLLGFVIGRSIGYQAAKHEFQGVANPFAMASGGGPVAGYTLPPKPTSTLTEFKNGPWVRQPTLHPDPEAAANGWYMHDGGECPLEPDTLVEVPAGTYHSDNGLMKFRAGDTEWNSERTNAVRNNIGSYRIAV